MREIKFRGRLVNLKKWLHGYILNSSNGCFIHYSGYECGEVDPNTVGQFTGLHDKDGAEIYEGDIVEWTTRYRSSPKNPNTHKKRKNPKKIICEVVWSNGGLRLRVVDYPNAPWNCCLLKQERHYKVTGNIHDNPELIK